MGIIFPAMECDKFVSDKNKMTKQKNALFLNLNHSNSWNHLRKTFLLPSVVWKHICWEIYSKKSCKLQKCWKIRGIVWKPWWIVQVKINVPYFQVRTGVAPSWRGSLKRRVWPTTSATSRRIRCMRSTTGSSSTPPPTPTWVRLHSLQLYSTSYPYLASSAFITVLLHLPGLPGFVCIHYSSTPPPTPTWVRLHSLQFYSTSYTYLGLSTFTTVLLHLPGLPQGSHSDWKNWKTWKNGKAFSSQGKVREFWTDWKSQGKVRENHTKYWKTEGISEKNYVIFQWYLNELCIIC